ncbi:MAG: hypothetical protein WBE76_03610 [Terracidiphilus sp.]
MEHASFIAESFGWWNHDCASGRHETGEECAEGEERRSCEQTASVEGVLHYVGEDGAKKAVTGKSEHNARGHAEERDTCGYPQYVRALRAERKAYAKLRGALSNAISNDAEDADQSERFNRC